MSLSFFCDKYLLPSVSEVNEALGESHAMWNDVKQYMENYGKTKEEWKIYSQKAGWCKKIFLTEGKKERNIIFLYPNINYFTCILVFGEKAVSAAEKSELPKNIIDSIYNAKQYSEGRSFIVEIRTQQDLEILKKLIDIKIKI